MTVYYHLQTPTRLDLKIYTRPVPRFQKFSIHKSQIHQAALTTMSQPACCHSGDQSVTGLLSHVTHSGTQRCDSGREKVQKVQEIESKKWNQTTVSEVALHCFQAFVSLFLVLIHTVAAHFGDVCSTKIAINRAARMRKSRDETFSQYLYKTVSLKILI